MMEATKQPASDPSSVALLRGEWQTGVFLSNRSLAGKSVFVRSRSSRLAEMQQRLDQLEMAEKPTEVPRAQMET